ncbi:MAG: hypothetical protein MZV70_53205 [Desulfobacterales bacterium]|nr:hypothetical protein [Desulfobacterales bacterium]
MKAWETRPPEGHMERFIRRLDTVEQRQKNLRQIRPLLATAAVAVACTLLVVYTLTGYSLFNDSNKLATPG